MTTLKYGMLSTFLASSFGFPELLEYQGLGTLIFYHGPYYPELLQTFYCNWCIGNDGIVNSCVKGTYIVLSMEEFGRC